MPHFNDAPESTRLIILGEVDPSVAGASDDADPETLRHLIPLEVGRIARSMGHHVTVVAGSEPPELEASNTEPWMHGVEWRPPLDVESAESTQLFADQQIAIISLPAWLPDLGTVRGNIDDPVLQAMTGLAESLADAGVERIVFVDVDDPGSSDSEDLGEPVGRLRRNTRERIESLLREESKFASADDDNPNGTELSFVVGTGPVWTQRTSFMDAESDEAISRLVDEGDARSQSADHGDRLEAVAVAALRCALESEYRPRLSDSQITDLGEGVFLRLANQGDV